MTKTKKIVLIIIACILFIGAKSMLLTRLYFNTWDVTYSAEVVKNIVLDNPNYYLIKKGKYCSGGNLINCKHWIGYIYYTDDFTAEQAMEKAGYRDIGHKYNDGKKTYTEYCTSEAGDHTIIYKLSHFLGGHLIEYHVVGVA